MYSLCMMQKGPKSVRNYSSMLLNQYHKELWQLLKKKEVQLSTGQYKVYLIKWLVSVETAVFQHNQLQCELKHNQKQHD